MSARFDQELGGFVAYQDNGDGTYSPLVVPGKLPAYGEPTVLTYLGTPASGGAYLVDAVIPTAGSYRVVVLAGSDNGAGVGNRLVFSHYNNGRTASYQNVVLPTPGQATWVFEIIHINANDRLDIYSAGTTTAGSLWAATLMYWRLA